MTTGGNVTKCGEGTKATVILIQLSRAISLSRYGGRKREFQLEHRLTCTQQKGRQPPCT